MKRMLATGVCLLGLALGSLMGQWQQVQRSGGGSAVTDPLTLSGLSVSGVVEAGRFAGSQFVVTNGFNRRSVFRSTNLQWRLVKNLTLTNVQDVSACAYYPSNGTLWTVHNNANGRLTEWTLDGVFVRKIDGSGSGLADCESITYLGGDKFAVIEEDANRIYILGISNNASGSTWTTNNCSVIKLDASIPVDGVGGGGGVEGICFDWDRNGWWVAKEKGNAAIYFCSTDGTSNYVWPQMSQVTNASYTDLSDLFLDRENQILWVSQDEGAGGDRVIGIDLLTSNVICTIAMPNFGQLEGVSLTTDGYLLVAGEVNQYAVFEPCLGGLNSGVSWNPNAVTSLPSTPQFPFGLSVGPSAAQALLTNVLYASASLDFPSTSSGAVADLPVTVSGAADGDIVCVGPPQGSSTGVVGSFSGFVSNGVVYVRFVPGAATQDPAPGTFKVRVDKFR